MYKVVLKALVISFLFSACSSDKSTEPDQVSVVGTWNLSSLFVNGVQKNPDNYNDVPVKLSLSAGGSGTVWIEDYGVPEAAESVPLTWRTNGNQMTIQIVGEDAGTVTYTVTASNLSLSFTTGSKLVYSKM